jgi:hypothetical protein
MPDHAGNDPEKLSMEWLEEMLRLEPLAYLQEVVIG